MKRVAIATMVLSMGVNFPDVRNMLCYMALLELYLTFIRKLEELVEMACLLMSFCIFMANSWNTVKKTCVIFLKTSGCYGVASYKSFDPNIVSLSPPHDCCNFVYVAMEVGARNQGLKIGFC